MEIHNLIQKTPDWHAFRAAHFPASEAPAMLGVSQYQTRDALLKAKATGITPDVDAATQRRFENGHRFEALARPLAEEIIGETLYPVTGSEGKLSASFDGLTMDERICFEHKSLNDSLRGITSAHQLPEAYRVQMEQQLMVSGAEKCLFMATSWNNDDELQEQVFCWYVSDQDLRNRIVYGWTQFAIDMEAYQPPVNAEPPAPDAILQLPAVIINVTGALSVCNLDEVTPKFDAFLAGANTDLQTDEDFANGEATAKFSRDAAKTLKLKAREVVGQISTVSEAVTTLELYAAKFDALGLKLEKAVKEQKEAIKHGIASVARAEFQKHCLGLDDELRGHGLRFDYPMPDFGAAMKSKRTLAALRDAVNTELASAKAGAAQLAQTLREKIRLFKAVSGSQHMSLFPDLQQIIQKAPDDFEMLVKSRIEAHQKAEAEKLEAERARIQREEEAKAAAKVRAEQEAIAQEQARQEHNALVEAEKQNAQANEEIARQLAASHAKEHSESLRKAIAIAESAPVDTTVAVIESQDDITEFLKYIDVDDKKRQMIRPYLVEFVKFVASKHRLKKAA